MRVQFCPRSFVTMQSKPTREELQAKLRSLRTAVVAGSGIAFLLALGLVATNPVGTQASTGSPDTGTANDSAAGQQPPANDPAPAFRGNPVTNAPQYQPPVLHSRRS